MCSLHLLLRAHYLFVDGVLPLFFIGVTLKNLIVYISETIRHMLTYCQRHTVGSELLDICTLH